MREFVPFGLSLSKPFDKLRASGCNQLAVIEGAAWLAAPAEPRNAS